MNFCLLKIYISYPLKYFLHIWSKVFSSGRANSFIICVDFLLPGAPGTPGLPEMPWTPFSPEGPGGPKPGGPAGPLSPGIPRPPGSPGDPRSPFTWRDPCQANIHYEMAHELTG